VMAIRCSNGGTAHTHELVAEVRSCWGAAQEPSSPVAVMDNLSGIKTQINPPSTKQVTYCMSLLDTKVWPDSFTEEELKAMERRQVSELIDGLVKAPRKSLDKGASGPKVNLPDVPAGRYALKKIGTDDEWVFYQVDRPEEGKWAGYVFVKMLIGAPGSYREERVRDRRTVLERIAERTPRQASIDYGLKSETCGVCSSPLSNAESLKLGIGPKCRSKMGW
jgi:hypothetical protein